MAGKEASGMSKGIRVGLATARILRFSIIVVILLTLAGRAFNADAQTVTILNSFIVSPTDGAFPWAGLVQGSDGNFYGTTFNGGSQGDGTVFRISSSGTYTNLYSFYTFPSDGAFPRAALVQGSDGNFYGTASAGGTHGDGTVFRIGSSGSETNLHPFVGTPDGASPYAGLVQGSDGNFYGTALYGGTSTNCGAGVGCGTVVQISPSGTYTTLYSF